MGFSNAQSNSKTGSWQVAVALVLSVLFAISIVLKAKSEVDAHNKALFDTPSMNAKLLSADFDATTLALRSQLSALSASSIQLAAANAVGNANIADNAVFGKDGRISATSTSDEKSNTAMAAAAQLATAEGWIGALAISDVKFVPAMAFRGPDNSVLTIILKLDFNKIINNKQGLIVTSNTGEILFSSESLKLGGVKNIGDALGIRVDSVKAGTGFFAKTINGDALIIGNSSGVTGFNVFVAQSQKDANQDILKILLFYGLLFIGPILAFFGIYFLTREQESRTAFAKHELRETERRMRIAIEGARCGVWDWDLTDDTVFLTQRLANSLGLGDADRYIGEEVLAAIVEEDRLKLRAALRAAIQLGVIDITIRLINAGQQSSNIDKITHLQLRGRAAAQKHSGTQIRIMGVSIDVSDRILIEQKSIENEKRLKEIANSMIGPFALWGRDGALMAWNEDFIKCFQLERSIVHVGAKYDTISKASAATIKGVREVAGEIGYRELSLKNGHWLRFFERKTDGGNVISLGFDITNQKAAEQSAASLDFELKKAVAALNMADEETATLAKNYEMAKSRAEAASKSKDVFLANMSHELRTPLNAIIGFSEMMARQIFGPLGDKRYLGYIQDINDSGNHLLELINGVLDMAKIEAGKFIINPQNMALEETISQAIRIIRGKAEEKNIKIETEIEKDDEIFADTRAIRQILINLLSNSVKFTEPQGRILVRSKKTDKLVVISVIDNGIGIDEKDIPRLAKPFSQIDSEHSRNNQGTGLGLALCQSFATMHGGRMDISSKLGVGTKIDIVLPIKSQNLDEAA